MQTQTNLSANDNTNATNQPVKQLPVNQVVIVGGGMVGLTLALMLAKQNIGSILLEGNQYPPQFVNAQGELEYPEYKGSFDARNSALSRRTVQIFDSLGIWTVLQQHATPIYNVHISEENGFGKACLVASDEKVESFGQVIENAWLGQVLLTEVRKNPFVQLQDGAKVVSIEQQTQQAVVGYVQSNQTNDIQYLATTLLIAADGRDSSCRQLLGVGNQMHDYNQVAIVTTVETSEPHQHNAYERFTPQGPLALLPLPALTNTAVDMQGDIQEKSSYRRSVVWAVKKGTEQQWMGEQNDQAFLQALQQSFGGRVGQFTRTAARFSYPLIQVLADQQAIGRVVLMGNAAHTLHPVAGQGFNLCVRDADVLCQMLTQQYNAQLQSQQTPDLGNPTVLKQYEAARLVDQKRVIFFCDQVVKRFSNNNALLKMARNTGLVLFEHIPGFKQLVANYAMGLKS